MKIPAVAAFVLTAGLFASNLYAQPSEARFTVPFAFIVSGRTLPAGSYRLFTEPDSILVIQKLDGSTGALSSIALSDDRHTPRGIVFHKYGDRYFLREIDSSIGQINGELPTSKAEKQAIQLEAEIPVEQVTVAFGN